MSNFIKNVYNRIIESKINLFLVGAASLIAFLYSRSVVKQAKKNKNYKKWQKLAEEARERRDAKINSFISSRPIDKISQETINLILKSDAKTLVDLIKGQRVKAVEALLVYAHRAGTIGKEYGWICDVDFEDAYQQAVRADQAILNKEEVGPLIGLPISIKDQMAMKNCSTTAGFTSLANNIKDFDSNIVAVLRKKGAIPFVRSNVPQGYFSLDSFNFLWGMSRNPWDRTRTSGGSSGGEAGLVAGRCSPLGIGSDIGGSIRVPSAFCGAYGFRPTSHRISRHGSQSYNTKSSAVGFNYVLPTWGPICRSADDVIFIMRNLFGEFENDVYTYNSKFDEQSFGRIIDNNTNKIKIAYLIELENFEAAEAIKDVMNETINKLKSNGYEVVPFPCSELKELIESASVLISNSDAFKIIDASLEGEEQASYYNNSKLVTTLSDRQTHLLSKVMSVMGEHRSSELIKTAKQLDTKSYITYGNRFSKAKQKFIEYWKKNNFQAIIAPVLPLPAVTIGQTHHFLPFNTITFLFNVLDMPSATIPTGLLTNINYNSRHNDRFSKAAKKELENSTGLPLAIQVGALPQQDEWVLRLMKDIDYFYQFDKKHGNTILDKLSVSK